SKLLRLPTPNSELRTPHSALRTPHSALRTPHSALRTPHSALRTPHSELRTLLLFTRRSCIFDDHKINSIEGPMSATERASFIHDPNLKVLIDTERLQARVRAMAEQITSDYAGKNLHLIGVLKGACVVLSDLMRSIDLPLS